MGWQDCTQIQEKAIPLLRKGKDVAGLAQTGTGKTGAFLVPLIDRLLKALQPDPSLAETETVAFPEWKKKQFILVLVPTRELADQVGEIAEKLTQDTGLSSVAIYGGTTYEKQIAAMKKGVEFVIATPGRFIDLYKEHVADLGQVRGVAFDEADRMFDMGFKDDMVFVLKRIPRDRQFLVFSATLNFDVLNTAYEFGADPVEINISRDQAKADNVKDHIMHVGNVDKPKHLLSLLKKYEPKQTIIFSNFKRNVELLTKFLNSNGVPAVGISSLLTQAQRNRVMEQFKADNDRNIMVATDVAARGLDILGVDMVVNYELPDDPENYVHRIGRTGRAGQTGNAFSMVGDRDVEALQRIESFLKHKVEALWLEDSELVTEMQPFPRDESRGKFGRPGGAGRGGPPGARGGPRGERGERSAGGGRGGPRREGGGGRDRDRDRDRERGPRGPRREGEGQPQRAAQGGGPAPRGESHRDRHSGRHQSAANGEAAAASNTNGRHAPRGPRGDRPDRPQNAQGGGQGGGRAGRDPRSPQNREQQRKFSNQRRGQQSGGGGGGGRPPGAQRPAVAAASNQGLGKKVSGFFKKLFGG